MLLGICMLIIYIYVFYFNIRLFVLKYCVFVYYIYVVVFICKYFFLLNNICFFLILLFKKRYNMLFNYLVCLLFKKYCFIEIYCVE